MAAVASAPGSRVGFSMRPRAVRRTSSQSRSKLVPPRGRTASATAAVARPSRTPNSADRPYLLIALSGYEVGRVRGCSVSPDEARSSPRQTPDSPDYPRNRPRCLLLVDVRPVPVSLEDDLAA